MRNMGSEGDEDKNKGDSRAGNNIFMVKKAGERE